MKIMKIGAAMLGATILSTSTASATTVKIMYAYTPTIKNSFGGTSQTLIKMRIKDRLNIKVFDESKTYVALKRVALFETDYDQVDDVIRQITRMTVSTSQMAEVLEKRDAVGADLVQLFAELEADGKGEYSYGAANAGGWGSVVDGYLLNVYTNPLQYVMAHEISHNFSATHGEASELSNGQYTITYAGDDSVLRVPRFSSWNWSYQGMRLGDTDHDNQNLIRDYKNTVKNFK